MSGMHEFTSYVADTLDANLNKGKNKDELTGFLDVNRSALRRKIDRLFGKNQYLTVGQLEEEKKKMDQKLEDIRSNKVGKSRGNWVTRKIKSMWDWLFGKKEQRGRFGMEERLDLEGNAGLFTGDEYEKEDPFAQVKNDDMKNSVDELAFKMHYFDADRQYQDENPDETDSTFKIDQRQNIGKEASLRAFQPDEKDVNMASASKKPTYKMKIYAKREKGDEKNGEEKGHAYFRLYRLDSDSASRYSFSFEGVGNINNAKMDTVTGVVRNPDPISRNEDENDKENLIKEQDISTPQAFNAVAFVRSVIASGRSYSANGYNSVGFVQEAAEAGGVQLNTAVVEKKIPNGGKQKVETVDSFIDMNKERDNGNITEATDSLGDMAAIEALLNSSPQADANAGMNFANKVIKAMRDWNGSNVFKNAVYRMLEKIFGSENMRKRESVNLEDMENGEDDEDFETELLRNCIAEYYTKNPGAYDDLKGLFNNKQFDYESLENLFGRMKVYDENGEIVKKVIETYDGGSRKEVHKYLSRSIHLKGDEGEEY